jgi:hypothetical protein
LAATSLRLLALLLRYARDKAECWPSNKLLGDELGLTARSVQTALGNLEQAGWITRRFGVGYPGGRLIILSWRTSTGAGQGHEARVTPSAPSASPNPVKPASSKGDVEREGEKTKDRISPPDSTPEDAEAIKQALAELRRQLAEPTPEPGRTMRPRFEPPCVVTAATTAEVLAQVVPGCPHAAVEQAVRRLMREFARTDRRRSQGNYAGILLDVKMGAVPTSALLAAFAAATGPNVERPGAMFTAVARKQSRIP